METYKNKKKDYYERHIVLVSPDVHWNTGNIGRTCIGTDTVLHLVKPLGFSLDSKKIKRAGLDYWDKVKLQIWDSFDIFKEKMNPEKDEILLFTKKGDYSLWEMVPQKKLFLVFGSETKGLPERILNEYKHATYHIPITKEIRSLNLSTAVGIALYESLRGVDELHGWF